MTKRLHSINLPTWSPKAPTSMLVITSWLWALVSKEDATTLEIDSFKRDHYNDVTALTFLCKVVTHQKKFPHIVLPMLSFTTCLCPMVWHCFSLLVRMFAEPSANIVSLYLLHCSWKDKFSSTCMWKDTVPLKCTSCQRRWKCRDPLPFISIISQINSFL